METDRYNLGISEEQGGVYETPREYKNYGGYINLLVVLNYEFELRRRLEEMEKAEIPELIGFSREEFKRNLESAFSLAETRDPLIQGLHEAIGSLRDSRLRKALVLKYGLDNPENEGRTLEEVAREIKNLKTGERVSGTRAWQMVTKATRQLRHPSRSKYYRDFIPS